MGDWAQSPLPWARIESAEFKRFLSTLRAKKLLVNPNRRPSSVQTFRITVPDIESRFL